MTYKKYFIGKTKNGKDRSFPLTPQIRDLLDHVKKVEMQNGFICEWIFADKNGRIHAPVISSCSKNKCRNANCSMRCNEKVINGNQKNKSLRTHQSTESPYIYCI